ncbi:DUF2231 domain-containing protein [Jiella marina]|uniref:DUF2231 domain-containing protein n=1 Tax=Jiella sp. LLJ827 TaxID=2917712 RepID=UPI002100C64F|nr:DUF2231 domain-containing protein [Jiella sp. LLJ827]MCQ0987428.1 DUF2231 domain-containing protein [Jiella sp. LLJ827]
MASSLARVGPLGRHPIHAFLMSFPVVCFIVTMGTDITYWQTGSLFWQSMSAWLLLAGQFIGALAALAGLIDILARPALRARKMISTYVIAVIVMFVLAFLNSLVHARDGWTGVVPDGLILSLLTLIAAVVVAWAGHSIDYRRHSGEIIYA